MVQRAFMTVTNYTGTIRGDNKMLMPDKKYNSLSFLFDPPPHSKLRGGPFDTWRGAMVFLCDQTFFFRLPT